MLCIVRTRYFNSLSFEGWVAEFFARSLRPGSHRQPTPVPDGSMSVGRSRTGHVTSSLARDRCAAADKVIDDAWVCQRRQIAQGLNLVLSDLSQDSPHDLA